MQKLQLMNAKLDTWNKAISRTLREEMLSLVTLPWYIPVRKGALTTKLVALSDTRKIDLEELLKVHQIRRGRVKFIKEGDFNSKYFSQGGN